MVEATTLVTAAQLLEMGPGPGDVGYELVKGELVEVPPVGRTQGGIAAELAACLVPYAREHDLGRVFVETGFRLECRPDTVRAPDVSLVKTERLTDRLLRGYFPGAPDLAVEVVSPGDTANYLESKTQDYLAHGAQRVWVIYPETRSLVVHRPDGMARRYGADETLTDEEFLPGFSLSLNEMFI